jgi:chromosomal replication initiator protein
LGRKRDKDTALARRLAMYVIRQETNYSLAQIGQEIGNRDAASVATACKRMVEDINSSPYIKRKIHDIQHAIHTSNNGH